MDWANWQTYAVLVILLVLSVLLIRRWIKRSEGNCCGGRCGCGVSRRKKKLNSR